MGGSYSKQQVTIKLKNKPNDDRSIQYPKGTKLITVTRAPYQTDFLKYTHTWDGKYRLAEIQDDSNTKIPRIKEYNKEVTSVSAYYWKHEVGGGQKPTKALMVEVVEEGGKKYSYYLRNVSGTPPWYSIYGGSTISKDAEFLEQTLDEQNCKHNSAVTIDLTKSNSKQGNRYCCPAHSPRGDSGRVSVTLETVSCTSHNTSSLTYYKHDIKAGGVRVAAIKYNDGGRSSGKRKRINIPDLVLPNNDKVKVTVYAFYCSEKNPILIYVEFSGSPPVKGWYQKGDSSAGDNEEWTKVKDLKDKAPDELSKLNCSDGDFSKLVEKLKELKCLGLQQCTIDPEHLGQNGVQREEVPAAEPSDQVPDTETEAGAHAIDISKNLTTSSYQCLTTGCTVSITFVTGNYSYYSRTLHSVLDSSIRRFRDKTVEQTGINSPEGATQVYVYHYPKGNEGIPLLIHFLDKWYQRRYLDSNEWDPVGGSKPTSPFDESGILKLLKGILPTVTINVGDTNLTGDSGTSTTYQDPGAVDNPETISLTKWDIEALDAKTGYTSFVHSVLNKPFVARDIKYGNNTLHGIDKSFILKSITAYYYGEDGFTYEKLLLIELRSSGSSKYTYYYRQTKGADTWTQYTGPEGGTTRLKDNSLKTELERLKKIHFPDPGLSGGEIAAISVPTVLTGGGLIGVVAWKWPSIMSFLITKAL